ncbi:MAG TPA: membrane protein insertion efficiency factor YidD [Thermoanaerobaculia bacterium]|nr:membrane protein insertion efficiency factor YidD [Thermoanaerobaculia bacterium]
MGRRKIGRARLIAALAVVLVTLLAAHDIGSNPGEGFGARAAIAAIDGYRSRISPRISSVVTCRFVPTCSAYGRAAIAKYGLLRGGAKAAARIARCGPWTAAGTVDPP